MKFVAGVEHLLNLVQRRLLAWPNVLLLQVAVGDGPASSAAQGLTLDQELGLPGMEGRLELHGVVYQSPGRRRGACAVRAPRAPQGSEPTALLA